MGRDATVIGIWSSITRLELLQGKWLAIITGKDGDGGTVPRNAREWYVVPRPATGYPSDASWVSIISRLGAKYEATSLGSFTVRSQRPSSRHWNPFEVSSTHAASSMLFQVRTYG
jgi:hypothetical protein